MKALHISIAIKGMKISLMENNGASDPQTGELCNFFRNTLIYVTMLVVQANPIHFHDLIRTIV